MERNRVCQICNRRFSNGKAMGGHMRSHFAKLLLPPGGGNTSTRKSTPRSPPSSPFQPKKFPHARSYRSLNRGLSFVEKSDPSSEDSPESNNTKSKPEVGIPRTVRKQGRGSPEAAIGSPADSERVSLVSDITFSDEDGAMCLLMMSRDTRPIAQREAGESQDEEDEDYFGDDDDDDSESICLMRAWATNRGEFKCETCNKLFGSYQALGGHRAGHKKIKLGEQHNDVQEDGRGNISENYYIADNDKNTNACSRSRSQRIFQCPYCDKVFESGQALGGHKKVHVRPSSTSHKNNAYAAAASSSRCKITHSDNMLKQSSLIDLNEPPEPEGNNEGSKSFHSIKRRML